MQPLEAVTLHPSRCTLFRPGVEVEGCTNAEDERWRESLAAPCHPELLLGRAKRTPDHVRSGCRHPTQQQLVVLLAANRSVGRDYLDAGEAIPQLGCQSLDDRWRRPEQGVAQPARRAAMKTAGMRSGPPIRLASGLPPGAGTRQLAHRQGTLPMLRRRRASVRAAAELSSARARCRRSVASSTRERALNDGVGRTCHVTHGATHAEHVRGWQRCPGHGVRPSAGDPAPAPTLQELGGLRGCRAPGAIGLLGVAAPVAVVIAVTSRLAARARYDKAEFRCWCGIECLLSSASIVGVPGSIV